ncbi:wnt inhibitory factor 1-like isoform X1 [Dermacentor albipictus]|uniref:wnt inhibitory factor 1-like isoform X1 n=1 Tax=Dermacentor albipictus TaxID=60249 RepID=UPI0038FD2EE0
MADALRAVAVVAVALLAMLAEASVFNGRMGAQMGMGGGCVPGQCLVQCQSTGSGVGTCSPQGCICGAPPGGSVPGGHPGMPCNNARCLATCREYNPSVVRAYCSSTGSCKCEWLQPPHEPCNVLKCDRQCRVDSRKPLMNARCAPNGSCRCTYRELCDEGVCRQQCLSRQTGNARTESFCERNSCHCRYSRVVFTPNKR